MKLAVKITMSGVGVILIFLAFNMAGCSSYKSVSAEPIYIPEQKKITIKQDTPRVGTPFNKKDFQKYMREQYKINYDDLIAPDLRKLYSVIESQARSISGLEQYMQVTRHRTDSIVRERNYYRKTGSEKDSIYQAKVLELQNTIVKLYNRVLEQERKSQLENKQQISINRRLTISCLIGVVVLSLLFLYLNKRINKLSRKLDTVLIKYQDNA